MNFFSHVVDFLKPSPPPEPVELAAMAHLTETVDPMLRSASHFEATLRQPLHTALAYCAGLVDALPGPIDISRQHFSSDPLVHALFATADDIEQMLGRSEAIRDYLERPESWDTPHFYALLAARREQKKTLGMAAQGEVIQNDVPQEVVYFCHHTLIEPSTTLKSTCEQLRFRALDSLLRTFQSHVQRLRDTREGLRAELGVERAHLATLSGRDHEDQYAQFTRASASLNEHLQQTANSLMPDPLLATLARFLSTPESLLTLKPVTVTIDRLGVISAPDDNDQSINTLTFPELTARDRRQHMVILARIDRSEARAAVEAVRHQQQRFMLI